MTLFTLQIELNQTSGGATLMRGWSYDPHGILSKEKISLYFEKKY